MNCWLFVVPKDLVTKAEMLIETLPIKRVMIANLQPGERITYTIFTRSKSVRVEAEVTQIERKHNLGRLWTTHGALPWQSLTDKYKLRL